MAVTMPTTSPSMFTSGPPELPGLAAASNWMSLSRLCLRSGETNWRSSPETTPADTDGPMPNGKPTATTSLPGARSRLEPSIAAGRSSGMDLGRSTARSFSGMACTTVASAMWPSWNLTSSRLASATTW
ncbi:hypothetical protein D9M72_339270 [compost metagenome]